MKVYTIIKDYLLIFAAIFLAVAMINQLTLFRCEGELAEKYSEANNILFGHTLTLVNATYYTSLATQYFTMDLLDIGHDERSPWDYRAYARHNTHNIPILSEEYSIITEEIVVKSKECEEDRLKAVKRTSQALVLYLLAFIWVSLQLPKTIGRLFNKKRKL